MSFSFYKRKRGRKKKRKIKMAYGSIGNINYEALYGGNIYSFDPQYSELFSGYRIDAGRISAPTSIQTADQLREVSSRLSEGVKAVEMQPISPEVFEVIPKQHMKEINRLSKLTGAEISMHAPMIDPAGFTREGWSEVERQNAERQLLSVIDRSHQINPQGNVPVTIHSSGLPGTEFSANLNIPEQTLQKMQRLGFSPAEIERAKEEAKMIAVNRETGQMIPAKVEERFYPEEGRAILTPREEIQMINNSQWQNNLIRIQESKKHADELMEAGAALMRSPIVQAYLIRKEKGVPLDEQDQQAKQMFERGILKQQQGRQFLQDVDAALRSYYNQAYKFSPKGEKGIEQKKGLEEAAQIWKQSHNYTMNLIRKQQIGETITSEEDMRERQLKSQATDELLKGLTRARVETFMPIEDFAMEKATQTMGNVAFQAWKKYGENTPILNLENMYQGMAFSRASDLKNLINSVRNKFVQNAKKEGMSESAARDAAEKFIGATWDMGHLSMLRKGGYTERHLIEETKKIAPYVKHVHIADNFGFMDSHLPPGMGTIPHKEMLEALEKEGFRGKTTIEAGQFVQHFKTSPTPFVLEAFGSPLYAAKMPPYWNQIRMSYGAYSAGYGTMLPEQHFSMYGGGFSTLPAELGGQVGGTQSRLAGTPNQ